MPDNDSKYAFKTQGPAEPQGAHARVRHTQLGAIGGGTGKGGARAWTIITIENGFSILVF